MSVPRYQKLRAVGGGLLLLVVAAMVAVLPGMWSPAPAVGSGGVPKAYYAHGEEGCQTHECDGCKPLCYCCPSQCPPAGAC